MIHVIIYTSGCLMGQNDIDRLFERGVGGYRNSSNQRSVLEK